MFCMHGDQQSVRWRYNIGAISGLDLDGSDSSDIPADPKDMTAGTTIHLLLLARIFLISLTS